MHSILALLVACVGCASAFAFSQTVPSSADPWASIASGSTTVADSSGKGGATYRYRLVEPSKEAIADPGARVPLVVFLHGSGERGADNRAQLVHFAGGTAAPEFQRKAPCYVLAMQCPSGETWSAIDLQGFRERGEMPRLAKDPTRAMRALMQAIDEVRASKAVDPTRVYLTGLSMGGFGAFDLAARRPGLFAAVVPICGGGDPSTAKAIASTPFYIVHGTDDPVVPVALSRAMREAIAGASAELAAASRGAAQGTPDAPRPMPKRAPNPMYREYDKVGHDSWTP
ncbi:MAG: dienelactone hydrolase family protein, partial [Phycisphaerales bacterium]